MVRWNRKEKPNWYQTKNLQEKNMDKTQILSDIYTAIFEIIDNLPQFDGDDAGQIAIAGERAVMEKINEIW